MAGKPLTYDLVAGARPAVVTYKRGQRASPRPIRFTVTNSATAAVASPPVRVTVKASEVSAKKLFGASLACRPSARTTVALPPGKSTTACTLTFSRPNVVARKAGKLNLVFSVACARSAEKSCANNVARATIVVK